jgi:putative N6-adenine-specific DNA methylase
VARRSEPYRCLAVTPPGVEELTAAELTALGISLRRTFRGGVEFSASDRQLYAANLWSRTATRIIVRVARFVAPSFADLERELAAVPWDRWIPAGATPGVRVSSTSSRLYHTDAVAERVAAAAGSGSGPAPLVVVRMVHDRVMVSVDSSGAPLHQRGWRLDSGPAPLRETLGAAMLLASGWDGRSPLVDPLCGSGTIAVEAALLAADRPPGGGRRFGFQEWPTFAPGTWASVTASPPPERTAMADDPEGGRAGRGDVAGDPGVAPMIRGSDRDGAAIAAARANAARAGVGRTVGFSTAPLSSVAPEGGASGWIVTNPPYGKRVGSDDLRRLYAHLGEVLRERFGGWTVALLVADPSVARAANLPLTTRLRTVNGGIPVHLLVGGVPVRSTHGPHDHRRRAGDRHPPH